MLTKSYSDYQIRELIPDALITLDVQDRFVYVNQIAGDMLERKPMELMGKHIWTEFPEAANQPIHDAYIKARQSKQHIYLEEYNSAHDRWFENHIYQSPGGVSICFSDITERKKKEGIFQSNELKYKAFFENSMDAVVLGYTDGTVYAANQAACCLFDRSEEEICSLGRGGLMDATDPQLQVLLEERKATGKAEGEVRAIRKDGTKIQVGLKSNYFTESNGEEHTIVIMRDNSELYKAKEKIQESEEKYRELVENWTEAIVIYTEEKVVFVNKETLVLMRAANKGQLIGKFILDFIHPDYRPFVVERMKKAAGEGNILPLAEEKFICLEGTEIDVEVKALPIVHDGKPSVQLIIRDITERKRAEEILHESEQKWSKLVTFIPDYIALHDLDGHYLFLNHFAEGYSYKDFVGKKMYDFMADDSKELFRKHFEQCINANQPRQFIFTAFGDNGVLRIYENSLVPIVDKEQKVVSVLSIAKDITERKLAEEKVKESEQLLNQSQRVSKIGSYKLEMGKGEWQCSHELENIFGIRESEVHTMEEWESVLHPDHREMMKEYFEKEVSAGYNRFNREYKIVNKKTGETHWVHGVGDLTFNSNGNAEQMLGTIQDITERKQVEQSLQLAHQSYFDIFNSVSEAIYILDAAGTFIDVNKGAEEMYLFTRAELIGQSPATVAAPDRNDLDKIQKEMQKVSDTGIPARFDFWAVRKNGEIFPKDVIVNRGKYFGQDVLIAAARDMTEVKKAEQALRESEHFLSEAQRISKIGSYKLDLVTGEWIFSVELDDYVGLSAADSHTLQDWVSLIHPDHVNMVQEYFIKDVIGKKQRFDKEYMFVNKKTGKSFWAHGIGDLEFNENGLPVKMIGTIQDITEKKEAEEILQTQEKLYRALIENSNDGVVILDGWGKFRYIAPSIKTVLGYDEEELLNTSLLNITHPDDHSKVVGIYTELLTNPGLYNPEFIPRIKHKDGSWRWISGALNNLINDTVVHGVIGNFRDVTKQVTAEQAIRESEIKYHSLIDNAGDGIAIYNAAGTVLDVNTTGLDMLGYTKEEVLKMKVTDFFLEEEIQSNPMTYTKLKPGESTLRQRNFKRKEGGFVLTEVRSQVLPDGNLLSIIRDLTERMAIQEQLRISNDNYSSLVNTIEGIVWEADAKSTQFSFVSMQAEQILGYPAKQWVTEKDFWPNHLHKADREWAMNYCAKYTKEKKSHDFEYRMIAADGRVVWLHDIVTVVAENDEPVKLRGLMIDITEKKIIEKGLEDYKFALNQSSIVDVSDSTGTIQYVNENFCRISGYSMEELKGRDHRILKSGYHSKEHYKDLWNTVASGKVWRAEVKNKAKDGSFYWVDSTIIPFLDDQGKPFQYITIRSDITKRKEAETQILNTLERYDILSKATSDTIWDWDVLNNVIVYNQGIVKNFGYKVTKVKNVKEWWDMNIHPDDRTTVHEAFDKAFQKRKTVVQVEYRYRSADGNYRHILDRAFIIYGDNKKPERMIGSMQDNTNEKEIAIRIEKEVIDAQEREWNQIGMELHDNVNQILAASMLLMGLGKEKMERGQNAASIINESEKHVGEAIAEIRRLSHQLAPVSVANLSLEQVFESLFETVNVNKQVKIKLQMKRMKEILIPHKLQINLYRILQEQLNNIMKHAKATEVTVSFKKIKHSFVFKIADNGLGFDPEAHTSGIGLENIKRRAKVFAGEFKLKTAPGKGCEIVVEIPENAFA